MLKAEQSLVLVIDPQERLVPVIADKDLAIGRILRMIEAARRLDLPFLVTEHCPDKIGPLLREVIRAAGPERIFRKTHFSAINEPGFLDRLRATKRRQILVCGLEAHVCVMQTVLDLLRARFEVFVAVDAIGSRQPLDRDTAIRRLVAEGATLVTSEMAIFEWLVTPAHPKFRDLLALVR